MIEHIRDIVKNCFVNNLSKRPDLGLSWIVMLIEWFVWLA